MSSYDLLVRRLLIVLAVAALSFLFGFPPALRAGQEEQKQQEQQEQEQEQYDPQAVQLLDKYVTATGGKAAYDAIKSRIIRAELSMPARGVTGKMTAYSSRDNKFHAVIETPHGKLERGWNGKTAWMIEPAFGPRILTGAERAAVIRDSTQDRFARWRELFQQAQYEGEKEIAGKKCAQVKLTYRPLEGEPKEPPVAVYLDLATGLIVQYSTELIGPQSLVQVTAVLDDYRKSDGVLLAHRMTLRAEDREQEIKVTDVECNAPIPDSIFVLPKEIQELLVK